MNSMCESFSKVNVGCSLLNFLIYAIGKKLAKKNQLTVHKCINSDGTLQCSFGGKDMQFHGVSK